MDSFSVTVATVVALVLIIVVYGFTGFSAVIDCYRSWFKPGYWTRYNQVEFISWVTKAVIIVPGLIFGYQIWWLFFLTLITSLTLIWASNKKLLPTLVGFNTLWVWISCMVIAKSLFQP